MKYLNLTAKTGTSFEKFNDLSFLKGYSKVDNLKEDSEEAPEYAVVYNATDYTKLDVIYKPGITYEETLYYSLASLQKAMGGND